MTEQQERDAVVAYAAWAKAQARAGVTVTPWPDVLQDDKYAWLAVYDACARDSIAAPPDEAGG